MILRECLGIARKRLKNLTVGASVKGVGLEVGLGFDRECVYSNSDTSEQESPLAAPA